MVFADLIDKTKKEIEISGEDPDDIKSNTIRGRLAGSVVQVGYGLYVLCQVKYDEFAFIGIYDFCNNDNPEVANRWNDPVSFGTNDLEEEVTMFEKLGMNGATYVDNIHNMLRKLGVSNG